MTIQEAAPKHCFERDSETWLSRELRRGLVFDALGPCIVGPSPRHQKTGRASSLQLFHFTLASTVQKC